MLDIGVLDWLVDDVARAPAIRDLAGFESVDLFEPMSDLHGQVAVC